MQTTIQPEVFPFFEENSNTFSYIVKDPNSNDCAIVDSVLDFDYASGAIGYESADEIIQCVQKRNLNVLYLIETHVHADHLSAAPYIQSIVGGKIAISKHIDTVQKTFGKVFNEGTEFKRDGTQFDVLFDDGETYQIGSVEGVAIHTPGHTPACMVHLIGDACFVGDTIFMPDGGTARADFPGGDARTLYQSIKKILSMPEETRLFMCHDYQPNGRELEYQTTVAQQKASNIHVHDGISENDFVAMREARDATLGMPKLIYPSLQTNMRAGHFPEADTNETVYLKVPISGLKQPLTTH
ncbi:MAG: MBL fold metallo-hydrolase [Porticoccaceae bacterium]